jgi:hypothetical protein
MAACTTALVLVATVQAFVSYFQWQTSREQQKTAVEALWADQTPHIRIWANDLVGVKEKSNLAAQIHIKNAGHVTLFNGQVSAQMSLSDKKSIGQIWQRLGPLDSVVMGPDDQEDYTLYLPALTDDLRSRIQSGELVVVLGARIVFPDAANRTHYRYICTVWFYNHGNMIAEICDTPPQN